MGALLNVRFVKMLHSAVIFTCCNGCDLRILLVLGVSGLVPSAARGGHLVVLQWLRAQDPPCPWDERTSGSAAGGGHLELLQWSRAQDPPCPWNVETCNRAVEEGDLGVLQWLRAQDPPCPWNVETCNRAAEEGNLDVLQWLRAQDPPCPWQRAKCAKLAVRAGREDVQHWILFHDRGPLPMTQLTPTTPTSELYAYSNIASFSPTEDSEDSGTNTHTRT
jgi:hypothetical protein